MRDRGQHQDRHGAIDGVQRVGRVVEEEDIGQPQHHPRHRHGQHRQELEQPPAQAEPVDLLDHVGAGEDDGRADHRRQPGQLDRVPVGPPAAPVHAVKGIVGKAGRHVIGPQPDQRGQLAGADDGQDEQRDQPAPAKAQHVEAAPGLGLVGHRFRRQQRDLLFLHMPVHQEGQHRRNQQHHRHHRPHLEVLLADHLLVDVDGQHAVLPADDLGQAEIGDDQREGHEGGRDQAVARPGDRHRPEGPPGRGAQRLRGLVLALVRQRQRGRDDDQRMGKGEEHRPDDDPQRAIDRMAHQQPLQQALVAEQINQPDPRQQRGHQDRHHGDHLHRALEAHPAAGQGIGKAEGHAHRQDGADGRDEQRIGDRPEQRRVREIGHIVLHPHRCGGQQADAAEGIAVILHPVLRRHALQPDQPACAGLGRPDAVLHRAAEAEVREQVRRRQPPFRERMARPVCKGVF